MEVTQQQAQVFYGSGSKILGPTLDYLGDFGKSFLTVTDKHAFRILMVKSTCRFLMTLKNNNYYCIQFTNDSSTLVFLFSYCCFCKIYNLSQQ